MSTPIRIVFMGTPEFAVESLKAIEHPDIEVAGVVTVADKPAGRGRKLRPSAVKQYAVKKGYTVLQPEKLKAPDFLTQLNALNADLFVVVAFRMLPEEVWDMPAKGTINLHASLLPDYRGASPINRAIMNGESVTGATTFFINENIDTGNIIDRVEVKIADEDTAGTLHDKLMLKGAELLQKTVLSIRKDKVRPIPQEQLIQGELHEAPKIFKEDTFIDWSQPREVIVNHIRGLNPYPGAVTHIILNGEKKQLKVFDVALNDLNLNEGEVEVEEELLIGTKNGSIQVLSLQLEGKKRMNTSDYLRGLQEKEIEIANQP